MQVFKLCLNIIRKNIPVMMIYVIVFIMVSTIMTSAMTKEDQMVASPGGNKTSVAFISEESSILLDGFKEELGKIANFVALPDETEALQDALFFRTVSYILRVPKGFTDRFMRGENIQLDKTVVPNSISNTYIELSIEKYFNTASLYVQNIEGITPADLVAQLKTDLAESTLVEVKTNGEKKANHSYANYFFNYFAFSLLSVIILGMSTLMLVFNNHDLKLRNGCSPISTYSMNLQFILANLMFTCVAWLFLVLICFIVNYKNILNANTIYFLLNSFVFAFCCSSISFLIGNLVKSEGAISAISNVVTLGLCFISGAFVPQELLGASVLKIASFTPTYWFVKANNAIAELTQFDFVHLKPILSDILIIVCFSLAFFAVALAVGKKKRYT